MKRYISLLLVAIFCFCLVGCAAEDTETSKTQSSASNSSSTVVSEKPNTNTSSLANTSSDSSSSVIEDNNTVDTNTTNEGNLVIRMPDKNSEDYYVRINIPNGYYKVLTIGGDSSEDSVRYLFNIAKNENYEFTVGSAHTYNSSISQILGFAKNGTEEFKYSKNTKGLPFTKEKQKLVDVIKDEKWDIIIIQQSLSLSGVEDSFADLDAYISWIKQNCDADCKIMYAAPWAYAEGYSDNEYSGNYNSSQSEMYNKIQNVAKNKVAKDSRISGVIPIGTAIQNIRNDKLGNNIDNGTTGLSLGRGQYAASLTIFCQITGLDANKISYTPPCTKKEFDVVIKGVDSAIDSPYSVK